MIIQDSINLIKKELKTIYPLQEIESFIQLIFDHLLNLSGIELYQKQQESVSEETIRKIERYITALKSETPIQYILGETEFYELPFSIDSSVLIPRPETEELVHWIISAAGTVISAQVSETDLGNPAVEQCIAMKIKTWKFPEPKGGGIVEVNYPFIFKTS